jgi:hypothetical protein
VDVVVWRIIAAEGAELQESDFASIALGRKEWRGTVRLFGTNSFKEGTM